MIKKCETICTNKRSTVVEWDEEISIQFPNGDLIDPAEIYVSDENGLYQIVEKPAKKKTKAKKSEDEDQSFEKDSE